MTQQQSAEIRGATLELFFDLVFTVTRLADLLTKDLSPAGPLDVTLILFVIWWVHSWYVWPTDAVAPTTSTRRTLLLAGLAGFPVMAPAVREAFGSYGWAAGRSWSPCSPWVSPTPGGGTTSPATTSGPSTC